MELVRIAIYNQCGYNLMSNSLKIQYTWLPVFTSRLAHKSQTRKGWNALNGHAGLSLLTPFTHNHTSMALNYVFSKECYDALEGHSFLKADCHIGD